jgi:predicted metal-dependent phosphoesterase TrpH
MKQEGGAKNSLPLPIVFSSFFIRAIRVIRGSFFSCPRFSSMPARQPFTHLCQQLSRGPHVGRADLHLHTTYSDGSYTPAEVVDLARRSGLAAIAVTDHDTTGGVAPAREAAGDALEVIAGAEITTEHRGRELHLLAYFIDTNHAPLEEALAGIRRDRVERFGAMIERLRRCGVSVEEEGGPRPEALGRRHLAQMLVKQGKVATVREAFARWLGDGSRAAVPKKRLPVAEAISLVRRAGGVAAWAHPAYDETHTALLELAGMGMRAVEIEYPQAGRGRVAELRKWAAALGLAVTGGSDCHGPGRRSIGARTISDQELDLLRAAREDSR